MARWKLCRQTYGKEEFTILEGDEITIGRGVNNNIVLSSIVISRNHCVIKVQRDSLIITDLKSSNGIYVGLKKIPPNIPFTITENELIGLGWTQGAPIVDIKNDEKFMFKLVRDVPTSFNSRIQFQSDNELDEIEDEIAAIDGDTTIHQNNIIHSTPLESKSSRKRSLEPQVEIKTANVVVKTEPASRSRIITYDSDIISILSDSDSENNPKQPRPNKKPKLDSICKELPSINVKEEVKAEPVDLEYDPFRVKQEYLGYDDPICIDSESDDGESVQWLMRLSQSSPGKPFIKAQKRKSEMRPEESSYSQIDDFDEDELLHDLITIPPDPEVPQGNQDTNIESSTKTTNSSKEEEDEDFMNDFISFAPNIEKSSTTPAPVESNDVVDGAASKDCLASNVEVTSLIENIENLEGKGKKAQMIQPLIQSPEKKLVTAVTESKSKKSSKHRKDKKHSSSKTQITNSQKEERKRKLKEIATKDKKEQNQRANESSSKDKNKVASVKLANTNRGAFLTDSVQAVQPIKRKESPQHSKTKEKSGETSPTNSVPKSKSNTQELAEYIENNKEKRTEKSKSIKLIEPCDEIVNKKKPDKIEEHKSKKEKHSSSKPKTTEGRRKSKSSESRIPLKSLKPLTESEESFSGKPFSKVEPMLPKKVKKSVRFSVDPPKVKVFEIEEGNNLKSTKLVKVSLDSFRRAPFFSLEKVMLMKILRWNPHWLEEQVNCPDPPPILGHTNPPMAIFHSFCDHGQYVQVVGDLLLMEIWECLTQGFMRVRQRENAGIKMTIGSLPPTPSQDRAYELFNISVDISVPTSEVKNVPRIGEILLLSFGPEYVNRRFFFLHNVRSLPSPKSNIHSFFSLSLHACYTDKMRTLKPGDTMIGVSLAFIQKELMLFEAMEYLAGSPLSDAILRPQARHFVKPEPNSSHFIQSQWTTTLNPSQQCAVSASVSAALSDKPSIQMVQGPPGTGKSRVICAIVMSYFYDAAGRRQQNRGKVLICATSNAAVDEIVCRLLHIRQSLPKEERFRMVRVGRAEAMHPLAFNISSQQLAQRDAAARQHAEPIHPGLSEEISHVEAKINMWRTQELDAKDPERAAYCRGRINLLMSRLALLRSSGGGGGDKELRADQLAQIERRIVEGADIVVTTLASVHNPKIRGLKRRIAICIVDEAGQAIEPETLIPLTLDVTHLTLIGDPQQLPGYICSQRAKKHGLGESLFSRLTSCAENWPEGNPVILLNQQYRMHPEIAEYPNRAFYGGCITTFAQSRPDLPLPPYCILSISSGDKGQGASGANEIEAWGVSRLVVAISSLLRPRGLTLAVITPYNAHKDLIKRNLRMLHDPGDPTSTVEVNTVDSFQGQERDVVVVSLARSHGVGFLTDAGRMNVMLTRAKHALLVCLNPHATLKNQQWRTLVEDAQKRNLFRILPTKMCQASPGQNQNDDILKYVTYSKSNM